jgi:hypothetical protein
MADWRLSATFKSWGYIYQMRNCPEPDQILKYVLRNVSLNCSYSDIIKQSLNRTAGQYFVCVVAFLSFRVGLPA